MRKNLRRKNPDYRGVSLIESLDFPLLFDTIEFVYGNPKLHQFFDECDLICKVVFGMTAKQFRISRGIERGASIRPHLSNKEKEIFNAVQIADLGLLIGCPNYIERKIKLEWYKNKWEKDLQENK